MMADGSCEFYSDDIDLLVWRALATRYGPGRPWEEDLDEFYGGGD